MQIPNYCWIPSRQPVLLERERDPAEALHEHRQIPEWNCRAGTGRHERKGIGDQDGKAGVFKGSVAAFQVSYEKNS